MTRSLVTGAAGFLGCHLVEALRARGDEVCALSHSDGDITDADWLNRVVTEARPQAVYHLAAQSFPETSWREPVATFEVNVQGTVHLLDALRALPEPPAAVLVVSSSSVYAPSPEGAPLTEEDPEGPGSLYGVSKLAQEQTAALYGERYGLPVFLVRPFFIIGPGKQGDVCSDFARRVVAVEQGGPPGMRVGRLDVVRDFLDVRDGVAAFLRVVEQGRAGEVYNVCSGKGVSLRDVLDCYRALASRPVEEELDPNLVRPIDEPVKVGDCAKLRALGWTPGVSLEESLAAILDHWRREDASCK